MRKNRVYYQDLSLLLKEFTLAANFYTNEYHYLKNVKRLKQKEIVDVFNGFGLIASAEVLEINKNEIKFSILSIEKIKNKPAHVYYYIPRPKKHRKDFMIEKAVEFGVEHIFWLNNTEYLQHQPPKNKEKINEKEILQSINALRQSERAWLLNLQTIGMNEALKNCLKEGQLNILLSARNSKSKKLSEFKSIFSKKMDLKINIFIGPEGGWSPEEEQIFLDNKFIFLNLGPSILRMESALLYMAVQIDSWCVEN